MDNGISQFLTSIMAGLLEVRPHIRVAHHIVGRIRLRVSPSLLLRTENLRHLDPSPWLKTMRGILDVRPNWTAGSLVVLL